MDYETQKKKRADALDDKRKRIEEMRKLRESRNNNNNDNNNDNSSSNNNNVDTREDIDNLVNSLLVTKIDNDDKKNNNNNDNIDIAPPIPQLSSSSSSSSSSSIEKIKKKLVIVKSLTSVSILPKPPISYDKECQTDDINLASSSIDDNDNDNIERQSPQKLAHRRVRRNSSPRDKRSSSIDDNENIATLSVNDKDNNLPPPSSSSLKILTQEEQSLILSSSKFASFLDQSSKVIERVINMNDSIDVTRDYSRQLTSRINNNTVLSLQFKLEDEFVRNRPIMDIHNSPHYPELFLASYGSKNSQKNQKSKSLSEGTLENESPGLVYIWSTALKGRPEFKFTSSSPVLVARFDSQDPHLVVGGCYNGQILLWDMRAKSLPVQRSNMSGKGHKHPVYAMCIIATSTTHELVSVSNDGTICHWDLSRLAEPISVLPLQPSEQTSAIAGAIDTNNAILTAISTSISCMTYTSSDTSKEMIFGCGNGSLLYTCLPFRPHDKVNHINAHSGLITALQLHPSKGKFYKNLLLSASLDWTVKLWNLSHTATPLMQFYTQSYDYVCDVQWSPVYPTIFSTILSGGDLTLWDLSKSTSEPLEVIKISRDDSSIGALNKCIWSINGNNIIIGDSKGNLSFLEAQESLIKSKIDDIQRFEINILNSSQSKKTIQSDNKDEILIDDNNEDDSNDL